VNKQPFTVAINVKIF
jgi:hypothetical protein